LLKRQYKNEIATPKRRRVHDVVIPHPYLLIFNNLRSTVEALANPYVPAEARADFIAHNPIPGAKYVDGLLINPNDIIPAGYDVGELLRDQRSVRSMLERISPKSSHLIGKCNLSGCGSPAQLVTIYRERFSLSPNREDGKCTEMKFPPEEIRFRNIRQIEPGLIVRGAISLLGEYPIMHYVDHRLMGYANPLITNPTLMLDGVCS